MPEIDNQVLARLMAQDEAAKLARDTQLREELAARLEVAPSEIDWTPLAAQLDALAGGDLAQKAAASNWAVTQKQVSKLDDLQSKLTNPLKRGRTMSEEAMLQQAKRGGIEQTQEKAQSFQEEQNDINRMISADDKAAAWVEKEINDPLKQSSNDIGMAEAALAGNDIAALNQSLPSIARGIVGQKGVLSDTDIALTIPKTYASTLAEFLKKINGEAEIPPSLVKNVQALIARAKDNIHRNAQNALKAKMAESQKTTLATKKGYVPAAYKSAAESDIVNYFKPEKTGAQSDPDVKAAFKKRIEELKKANQ